jgi:acyl-CoA thioesterase-2
MTASPGQRTLTDLVDLLPDADGSEDVFLALSPANPRRIYGGQLVAQSLLAAGRTVPEGWLAHSLHTYFLNPGKPDVPLRLHVERRRDGKSFAARRVVAMQDGRPVTDITLSFASPEPPSGGRLDHGQSLPAGLPDPESLPTTAQWLGEAGLSEYMQLSRVDDVLDVRYVTQPPPILRMRGEPIPLVTRVWCRLRPELDDRPLTHQVALAYLSDTTLAENIVAPYNVVRVIDGGTSASLDHAVWFHRPFRADEWMLYESVSPVAIDERGLVRGTVYSSDGAHIATTTQEMLIRLPAGLGAQDPGGA